MSEEQSTQTGVPTFDMIPPSQGDQLPLFAEKIWPDLQNGPVIVKGPRGWSFLGLCEALRLLTPKDKTVRLKWNGNTGNLYGEGVTYVMEDAT